MRRVRPRPLRRGDVIAVVAPGGPVDPARLARGLARLTDAGFVPETAEGVLRREGYLAGNDGHRAAQMEWALTLPEARAVMAARGGYGTTRLLPLIDWKKAAARPRLLIGYSDLTAVLAYVSTRLRLAAIHGPMAAADLAMRPDPGAVDAFVRLAGGRVDPREPWGEPCERLRGGAAEGVLTGGCLSVLTAMLGTPHEPDFRGALLFLEDVREPSYRIDRMLTQWIQSGRLRKIAGIVAGRIAPVKSEGEEDVRRAFAEAGKRIGVPVWCGFPAGHTRPNYPLPFGVRARIDGRGRLFLLESPVAAK
ncbi:MAG TPA: LD-carboxypeptidase [Candidatus Deferrimicrobiaceae bacterium]|nr:LD-carboxypeptidase [Candidatus Deferrimicrobiaceae bacterium]